MTDTPIDTVLLAFGLPHGGELVVILIIGLLIFGRRLPEVGRSIGTSIGEFKRGVKGIHEEIDDESSRPAVDEPAQLTDEAEKRVESTPAVEEMPSRHDEAGS
jgi:sec-independent protein translocase protein TatA